MCGILAVLSLTHGPDNVRTRVLDRARRLRHRGPDWSGVYNGKQCLLAHERLAIVDVESGGQPILDENKTIALAVNGEIYNHKILRAQLPETVHFATESDCEIILHRYKLARKNNESMSGFLNELNGIFAFILVDDVDGSFVIGRDHMGIIPLYVGRDVDGAIWVASELKAIADATVTFEEFPPGHYWDSRDGPVKTCWYKPNWHDETFIPETTIDLKELRSGLENAVRRQLMSDVPYGVLLSGGLDSSLIAAIAASICAQRVEDNGNSPAWWPRLHSFSVGLIDSPDLAAARTVAKHIGTVHHEITFTISEGLTAISDVIYHLETYDVTTIRAATPMYLMSRKIKCLGVKMVLSGEGSDEMFGGYLYFHKCPNHIELQKELIRKLKSLYKFDCLRANKATAAWGVEARVPFLDREFLDYVMNINPQNKLCGIRTQKDTPQVIEKYILRKAFDGLLPENILYRQKEQFSDGVGYNWIDSIKALADTKVTDHELSTAPFRFPYNPPQTKEAFMIRSIFETHFPQPSARECVPGGPSVACSTPAAILWDESFKKYADASGRSVLGVHTDALSEKQRGERAGAQLADEQVAAIKTQSHQQQQ